MNSRYYIVGIKHSGKSSVGRAFAEKLDIPFYDLDELIEESVGMGVREYYKKYGKEAFQREETRAVIGLQSEKSEFVCATGGGICDNLEAFALLKDLKNSIYINTCFETVWDRIAKGGIPAFLTSSNPEEEFRQLFSKRNLLYKEMAYLEIDGNLGTPEQLADICIKKIEER